VRIKRSRSAGSPVLRNSCHTASVSDATFELATEREYAARGGVPPRTGDTSSAQRAPAEVGQPEPQPRGGHGDDPRAAAFERGEDGHGREPQAEGDEEQPEGAPLHYARRRLTRNSTPAATSA